MAGTDLVPVNKYSVIEKGAAGIELLRETLEGQDVNEFSLARVKIPAGGGTTWEVPTLEGEDAVKELQGVVVFYKNSRSFWEGEYDGSNDPPDCSSTDAKLARKTGDVEIPAAVDNDSGLLICDTCKLAQFGSATSGSGRGQACKLSRQLFIITPDRMLPIVLSLPPTSLKSASNYFLTLADYSLDYKRIVTRVTLEKTKGNGVPDYSVAKFAKGDEVDEDTAKVIAEYAAALKPHFEQVRVENASEIAG